MSKEMGVILLGVAVIVIPYLGVPSEGRTFLLVLAGLTLIVVGYMLRSAILSHGGSSAHHSFVENDTAILKHEHPDETHKEGINSLN